MLTAKTLLDVRRVLSSSRTGRLYLYTFWLSVALLCALTISLHQKYEFVGFSVGYSAFAFTRELLTLRGTYELHRLSTEYDRGS